MTELITADDFKRAMLKYAAEKVVAEKSAREWQSAAQSAERRAIAAEARAAESDRKLTEAVLPIAELIGERDKLMQQNRIYGAQSIEAAKLIGKLRSERDTLSAKLAAEEAAHRELFESIDNYLGEDHARVSGGAAYIYIKGRISMAIDRIKKIEAQS